MTEIDNQHLANEGINDAQAYVDGAGTLDDLGFRTLRILKIQSNVADKYMLPLLMRLPWADGNEVSLQAAADVAGVSRQRMAQIQAQLYETELQLEHSPPLLYKMLDAVRSASTEDEFWEKAQTYGIVDRGRTWSLDAVGALFEIYGFEFLTQEWNLAVLGWTEKEYQLNDVARECIRTHRNSLGLLSTVSVAADLQIKEDEVRALVKETYPHVYGSDDLIVANSRGPGQFFSTLIKQLLIHEPLTFQEIDEGLRRVVAQRSSVVVGSPSERSALLGELIGHDDQLARAVKIVGDVVRLSESEVWLREVFRASPSGLLHRDEIVEAAIKDGRSISSVNAYLSTSPILRRCEGVGIYRLVGRETSDDAVRSYRAAYFNGHESPKLHYRLVSADVLELSVPFTYSSIAGGSFFSDKTLSSLIESQTFASRCGCDGDEGYGEIRLTDNGVYILGFSKLLHHAHGVHDVEFGKSLTVMCDFSDLSATLVLADASS